MAVTSGEFTTNEVSGRSITFSWWISSQDLENNITTLAWDLIGSGSFSGYVQSGNFKVIINGVQVYFSATRINLYNGTLIASGFLDIQHNEDGSKSFGAYAEAGVNTVAVSVSGSGSWELLNIPRGIIRTNVSGIWKQGLSYVNVNGVWKQAIGVYTNVNGTWKQSI